MVVLSSSSDELDEEPGEVIESAPPQKVGEERELGALKKKLLKRGHGWETPNFNDIVTVHCVRILLDGSMLDSTRGMDQPRSFALGQCDVAGLDSGIVTMKKGEVALFTLPEGGNVLDKVVQFEVELVSWITVVDVCKDGGVIKKIMEKGSGNERPADLDEVLVKYRVALIDGTVVVETLEGGVEFHVKDGHLFPILPKVIMTMTRGEKAELVVQPQYAFGEKGREAGNGLCSIPPNSVLHVSIELVSFKPVINVTGDSKVLKKILKEGEGAFTANEGANFTVSYTAMLEDGTVFEKRGIDEIQPLEFITDEEQVITGLDQAVGTMKKGERAKISLHPDYAFGNVEVRQDLAIVPPGSNVVYDIEMMDFIKEKGPWELTSKEKIEVAGRKKEEGNVLFKGGNYQRAGKKYEKEAEQGRPVEPDALFLATHRRSTGQWVDDRSHQTYDAYQARLEEVTFQAASTPGSQPPDVAHKIQIWREVSWGVTRGRCYGTADLSANVRHHAPTLTQESSAPSQSSRSGSSDQRAARAEERAVRAEEEAARAREEAAKAWEEAARAREKAAKAREDVARANQRLDEILARLNRVEQAGPSAPAPPPPPSGHGHADYENEFDPLLDSDDPVFH